jgi:hypothetical protein
VPRGDGVVGGEVGLGAVEGLADPLGVACDGVTDPVWMHVTPLFPPWASQLPLLFVVLHAGVTSAKQINSTAIGTWFRRPPRTGAIMVGPISYQCLSI